MGRPDTAQSAVLQLYVELLEVQPPVWRRLLVAADSTFWDLHVAIQNAMGWADAHLHLFVFGEPDDENRLLLGLPTEFDEVGTVAGWTVAVTDLISPERPHTRYEYDFGDGWSHMVSLEGIFPADSAGTYPRCVAGARCCPPEDVGGVSGYEQFLEAIGDPTHAEHDAYLQWCGGAFDPERFDPAAVVFEDAGERLREVLAEPEGAPSAWRAPQVEGGFTPHQMHQLLYSPFAADSPLQLRPDVAQVVYETAPLVRDMLSYLRVVGELGPIKLTQRGNLPVVAIGQLAAAGALPAEPWLVGRAPRTEADAPRAELLRLLANLAGLTRKTGGRLQLTQRGARAATGRMGAGALWQWLLERHAGRYSWAYADRMPESRMLQACFWYVLFLLQQHGSEPRTPGFYAQKVLAAFPPLIGDFPASSYSTAEADFEHALSVRALQRFAVEFGLACLVPERGADRIIRYTFAAGPLLAACVTWRLSTGQAAQDPDERIIVGPWPGAGPQTP